MVWLFVALVWVALAFWLYNTMERTNGDFMDFDPEQFKD